MLNFKMFVQRALLAIALATGSAVAVAGPTYHVNVNTAGYTGIGQMDFNFIAINGAAQAQATLSNFSGGFASETDRFGAVSGAIPGIVNVMNADGVNYLTQAVSLGGLFGFDISFSGDFLSGGGNNASTFGITLYNETFSETLGVIGNFAQFDLNPAISGQALVTFSDANALADIAVVPEPSELLLLLTGLGLMGFILRRRAI